MTSKPGDKVPHIMPPADTNNLLRQSSRESNTRQRWTSIIIAYVIVFLTVIQGSLYWSSLWPFLSQLDPEADEKFLGYIISSYNLASVLASPALGWLSNRLEQTKIPILIGISAITMGNILCAFVPSISTSPRYFLLLARFITGLGTGNLAPLTAYVIMASKPEERNQVVSARTTVSALALILGPALQAAFVPIGYPGSVSGSFHLSMYTAPAWLGTALGIGQLVMVILFFKEVWVSVDKTELKNKEKALQEEQKPKPYDKVAVTACIATRFFALFVYSYDNTIGSPFTMAMFNWSKAQAVLYNGIIQLCGGVECVAGSILIGRVCLRRLAERVLVIAGLISFLLFFAISYSYPGLPPMVSNVTQPNTSPPPPTLSTGNGSSNATQQPGCNYAWCAFTTRINILQYVIGFAFMIAGYVVVQTANGVLFSKVTGPRKQGSLSGLYQSSGKMGMTVSPLLNTYLFQYHGPRVTWIFGSLMLCTNIAILSLVYRRLTPWTPYEDANNSQFPEERIYSITLNKDQNEFIKEEQGIRKQGLEQMETRL